MSETSDSKELPSNEQTISPSEAATQDNEVVESSEHSSKEIPPSEIDKAREPTESKEEASSNKATESSKTEIKQEAKTTTQAAVNPLQSIGAEHEELRHRFGLDKPVVKRHKYETVEKNSKVKAILIILVSVVVVAACVGSWVWGQYEIRRQEQEQYIARKNKELADEIERRNQIEYADIAFLDSFPPNVDIRMDGKKLYARSQEGYYTELRARESTWIRNLPIKESTVLSFGFEAEGFHPMERDVAYYDWFPNNKSNGNPLQKVFRRVVLEPDVKPRMTECAQLPHIVDDEDPCEWTVFREIVFREKYAEAVSPLNPEDDVRRKIVKSLFERQPLFGQAARGFDVEVLNTNKPVPDPELPDATKTLLKNLLDHPYGLYGAITIETDTPDTRVFFMSEPLMVVRDSGSMAQVKVQPDAPYTFAVYGQGRPISITDKLSIRLETDGAPAFVTEISPFQWHCDVPSIEKALEIPAPEIAPEVNSPDYRHYLCTYSLKISVNFSEIKELEAEAAKQRENAEKAKTGEAVKEAEK